MADFDDDFGDDMDLHDEEISQQDCWAVVTAYFDEKGLVRQQLDSFDEFIQNTMQEMVDDQSDIVISPQEQYMPGTQVQSATKYVVSFGQVYMSKPTVKENDGSTSNMFPHEARLRNLTYSAPLYIDVNCVTKKEIDGIWEDDEENSMGTNREFVGYVPIMLRSEFCVLKGKDDRELAMLNECIFDQGGYFIINGSEKVLVAQERMAANIVYCFEKKNHKFCWVSQINSHVEQGLKLPSQLYVQMYAGSSFKGATSGNQIRCVMPYIRQDIPVVVLFRALGCVADRDILERICYQFDDTELMDKFRPSLEEAFVIQDQNVALDYIGRRGSALNVPKADRIAYAKSLLEKELLPHVGMHEHQENKKAFFLGYMVNKLLHCSLGRQSESDRDHFANKRLDLAGPLMAGLFRSLFKRLRKDVYAFLQKCVDHGKDFNLTAALKTKTITNGLRYSLATGNWGDPKMGATKAGVSQVLNRLTYASTLSHLRRLNTPLAREGKMAKPRQLHNTHWGYMCPAETPEGQAVGLVKNMSLMCYVSVGSPQATILELLEEPVLCDARTRAPFNERLTAMTSGSSNLLASSRAD